jgi:hypothetical protein
MGDQTNRACSTHKGAKSTCIEGMVGKCEGMRSHQRLRCRWENNIKRYKMGRHGLDSSSQGQIQVAGTCGHSCGTSGFVKYGEFLDWPRKYKTLKNSTPWGWL